MDSRERRHHCEILELPSEASPAEIRKAYLFLKELYSSPSIVTAPLESELSAERQHRIRQEIEAAYQALAGAPGQSRPDQRPPAEDYTNYNGQVLRQIRQQLRVELQDMALATNIQTQYLEDIENENYASLPVYVYTRGYVVNYAKFLRLDHQKVTTDYMSRFMAIRGRD